VNANKIRYMLALKVDKPKIAREVVNAWRGMTPPGRFLARCHGTDADLWYEVSDQKAREKASQNLREITPHVQSFMKQLEMQRVPLPAYPSANLTMTFAPFGYSDIARGVQSDFEGEFSPALGLSSSPNNCSLDPSGVHKTASNFRKMSDYEYQCHMKMMQWNTMYPMNQLQGLHPLSLSEIHERPMAMDRCQKNPSSSLDSVRVTPNHCGVVLPVDSDQKNSKDDDVLFCPGLKDCLPLSDPDQPEMNLESYSELLKDFLSSCKEVLEDENENRKGNDFFANPEVRPSCTGSVAGGGSLSVACAAMVNEPSASGTSIVPDMSILARHDDPAQALNSTEQMASSSASVCTHLSNFSDFSLESIFTAHT
jgi:hypothetical protein